VVLNDRESNENGVDNLVEPYHGGAAVQKHRWLILKQLSNARIHFVAGSPCCSSSLFLHFADRRFISSICLCKRVGIPLCIPFN